MQQQQPVAPMLDAYGLAYDDRTVSLSECKNYIKQLQDTACSPRLLAFGEYARAEKSESKAHVRPVFLTLNVNPAGSRSPDLVQEC